MRIFLSFVFIFIAFLALPLLLALPAHATSQQAYQDYLYQFDLYRQTNTDFQVAKNEYLKFKSLTSQATALIKTKTMLAQRNELLRAYLFLLNEKLNEDRGLAGTEKQLYQTLIANEVTFLDAHKDRMSSIGSIDDTVTVSRELESHYMILYASMRQTVIGIMMGDLAVLTQRFDTAHSAAQSLVNISRGTFTPQKQATLDRWLLQIANKRSLYQQKIETIRSTNNQLKGNYQEEIDRNFQTMQKDAAEAKQYLSEGTSNLMELMNAVRYQD
ncbi:hypothetical protein HY948_04560 [Candidatus Gottesmanbacteria bacterium]|nr:hypothetical protein [Candidatus Gottesmanbacteria bacterium]